MPGRTHAMTDPRERRFIRRSPEFKDLLRRGLRQVCVEHL